MVTRLSFLPRKPPGGGPGRPYLLRGTRMDCFGNLQRSHQAQALSLLSLPRPCAIVGTAFIPSPISAWRYLPPLRSSPSSLVLGGRMPELWQLGGATINGHAFAGAICIEKHNVALLQSRLQLCDRLRRDNTAFLFKVDHRREADPCSLCEFRLCHLNERASRAALGRCHFNIFC